MCPPGKRCWVAYATPARQYLWCVEVAEEASVREVLVAARASAAPDAVVPWEEASVGIFGEPCSRDDIPRDGDRVELYRQLAHDPKEARRERARQLRRDRHR
ncbi:MAG TPA: RnfH family protein [Steroidobacteraceae bacterium]|nr:RnfH family protein [Steroidobacteraceae bacterium]